MNTPREELEGIIVELREFKKNIYGCEAIDKIRRMYMMSGIFAYSFDDELDRRTAYQFVSIMAHHSGKRDADITGVLAEYLDNYLRLMNGEKKIGKCCISLLPDDLFIFMKNEAMDNLIEAAKYVLYGNEEIDKSLPYGHLLKSQRQAEAIYNKYLEAYFNIQYSNSISP
jgi:hypothetical protein